MKIVANKKKWYVEIGMLEIFHIEQSRKLHMTHSQMLGKFEYTRGPIFKVVLEC